MSTIFGIIDKTGEGFDPHWLEIMKADLSHGTPDESGIWLNEKAGLGNLLVFNTPESLTEKLPFENQQTGHVICSDSRIDNRSQMAGLLSVSDSDLKRISDSDLVMQAYLKRSEECCNLLRGDFCFAIYDPRQHFLFIARDHFGMRPLFYFDHPRYFVFSSELRGILALPFFDKELNKSWLLDFLINVEREEHDTFYQGIHSLPPGHRLVVSSGRVEIRRYWELTVPDRLVMKTDEEYIAGYKALFESAVKNRVRSAFPVGAELSGGLDSSSIAAVAQKNLTARGEQLHAFARVLPEKVIPELDENWQDETAEIEMVCNFCRIENIQHVTLEDQRIIDNIRQNIDVIRSPFYSNYAVYNLNANQTARSAGVRTILSGHGGDQMLTNPAHFVYTDYKRKLRYFKLFCDIRAQNTMHELGFAQSLRYFFNLPSGKTDFSNKRQEVKKLYRFGIDPGFLKQHDLEKQYLKHRQQVMLLPDSAPDLLLKITQRHLTNRIEVTSILAGHDQIEFRYPMFDVDLIRYYLAVPDEIKRKFRVGRYIHRMAMQDELPASIQWRKDKNGTINPGLPRIFTNEAGKIKTDMQKFITNRNSSYPNVFDLKMIEKLIAGNDSELFKFKSLINKFFQLQTFEKIIENKLGNPV